MEGRSSIGNSKLYPVHTPYIQILVDGGLFLFFQFIYIVFDTFRKLEKFKDSNITQVFLAGFIAIGISYIFEYSGLYHLMILIPLALNIDCISNCLNSEVLENGNKMHVY